MAADGPAPYIPLLGSADRAKSTRAASLALGGIALGALLLFAAGSELLPFPAQLLQLPLKSFEASATVAARPPDAVTSLPGAPPLDTVQYAGLVTVNSTARNKLFYWFAESSRVKDDLEEKSKVPIVIWLNGGPGASSMTGWLIEKIGPFELQSDAATLTPTGLPWHELAHVMMWDQPVGAGYATTATGTYAASMEEAAADLLKGMTEFYKIHPEYKDSDVYVTGESFAGKWIPHFCYHVYETNKALVAKGEPVEMPLVGMAIGNGVLYPYLQTEAMVTMATGLGYTDPEKLRAARKNLKACKQELEAIDEMKERPVPSHDLWKSAYFKCDALEKVFGEAVKFIYDIRSPADEFSALSGWLSEYLNKEEVRKALNVGETKWVQQDGGKPGNPVSDALWEPQISDLPDEMLATLFNEYKVLMYAGQYDGSSCNALGVAQSVDVVANEGKWADASKYANTTACTWTVNGIPSGVLRATGKFGNLVFLNSGHLVPMNQPAAGYEMIRQLVYSDTFTDMC